MPHRPVALVYSLPPRARVEHNRRQPNSCALAMPLPATMRAIQVKAHGDSLVYGVVELPAPTADGESKSHPANAADAAATRLTVSSRTPISHHAVSFFLTRYCRREGPGSQN